jgi:hypothetical protein
MIRPIRNLSIVRSPLLSALQIYLQPAQKPLKGWSALCTAVRTDQRWSLMRDLARPSILVGKYIIQCI